MGYTPRNLKKSTDLHMNSYIEIKQSFEGQSFPILTNRSRVWLMNHLYHDVAFTDCERQDKIFVIVGLIVRWDRQNQFVIARISL